MAERITLNQAPEGSRVRVRGVGPAHAARGRLCALGIIPGAEIEVFSQGAQCRIRIRDASLALCSDLASCIECEALNRALPSLGTLDGVLECENVECGVEFCLARSPAQAHAPDRTAESRRDLETAEWIEP